MLWFKSFHIISMVAWYAGLFYLPRLFVYHAMNKSKSCNEMLKVMEYKLFNYIMNPALLSTLTFGIILLLKYNFYGMVWIKVKIALTLFLVVFHLYLGSVVKKFKEDKNKHNHKFYRFINEVPTLILLVIVPLVVIKPF